MNIIDNFLPKEELDAIKKIIDDGYFPWFFFSKVSNVEDTSGGCYFTHTFYNDSKPNSSYFSILDPIIQKIKPKALIRCRAIMYVNQEKLIEHGRHIDYDFSHKTCLLYLNSNDGFTRLHDGECVSSIENRALFFDGSLEHNSTNCTNQQTRQLIAISYF
jgi:hypothetical protein